MKKQQGFTLVEVTIILLVLVILSTIMLPQMGNFNRLARFVKVREDIGAICASAKKMLDEVMLGSFYKDPATRTEPVGLLVGPGATPVAGSAIDGRCLACPGTQALDWRDAANLTGQGMTTDDGIVTVNFSTGYLADHLQQNQPDPANAGNHYKNVFDDPQLAGAYFGWRGPYFDALTTDPWGNRYAVNTFALHKPANAQSPTSIYSSAVVCYSAGPDGAVDTIINQPMNDADGDGFFGWKFGDDDQGAILSAGGPF